MRLRGALIAVATSAAVSACGSSVTAPTVKADHTAKAVAHQLRWTSCEAAQSVPYTLPGAAWSGFIRCDEGTVMSFDTSTIQHNWEEMFDPANAHRAVFANGFVILCQSEELCRTAQKVVGGVLT